LDITVGTPLVAPEDLIVLSVGTDKTRGHYIEVGLDGERFIFNHLQEPVISERGNRIPKDTVFAQTGDTGNPGGKNADVRWHVEYKDGDGQTQDPLKSSFTADFFAQASSNRTEEVTPVPTASLSAVYPVGEKGRDRGPIVVSIQPALDLVNNESTISAHNENIKALKAKEYVQEHIAKYLTVNLQLAGSLVRQNIKIPGEMREILQQVGGGTGGGKVFLINGSELVLGKTKQEFGVDVRAGLIMNATIFDNDAKNIESVRTRAANMAQIMAYIESKVVVPRKVVDYFSDIRVADEVMAITKHTLEQLKKEEATLGAKFAGKVENKKRAMDEIRRLRAEQELLLPKVRKEREAAVRKLFELMPSLWPNGLTIDEIQENTVIDYSDAQIQDFIDKSGIREARDLRLKLANEKVLMLEAAIPAGKNYRVAVEILKGIIGATFSGGVGLAVSMAARMTVKDPVREALQDAGVWAYAQSLIELAEATQSLEVQGAGSAIDSAMQGAMVRLGEKTRAEGVPYAQKLKESYSQDMIPFRDYLGNMKSDNDLAVTLARLKREEGRADVEFAKFSKQDGFKVLRLPDPIAIDKQVEAAMSGSFFFLDGMSDSLRARLADLHAKYEKALAPVNLGKNPGYKPLADMLLGRSYGVMKAMLLREQRLAELRSVVGPNYNISLYLGPSSEEKDVGNVKYLSVQAGVGLSYTFDPSKDLRALEYMTRVDAATLNAEEVTNRELADLGHLLQMMENFMKGRSFYEEAIQGYKVMISQSEKLEEKYNVNRTFQKNQDRKSLADTEGKRIQNEANIKQVQLKLDEIIGKTNRDTISFESDFRAHNIHSSFPYLRFSDLVDRTEEEGKVKDRLNKVGKDHLEKTGAQIQSAHILLGKMKDHIAAGSTGKVGTQPSIDVQLIAEIGKTLVAFEATRQRTEKNAITGIELYKDLNELSQRALSLMVLKASLSPSVKWQTAEGLELDKIINDWDKNFRGRFDAFSSERIALKTAEGNQLRATIAAGVEPLTANINFGVLFVKSGGGAKIAGGVGVPELAARVIEMIFSGLIPEASAAEGDEGPPDSILGKIIPGYQTSQQRAGTIKSFLMLAQRELMIAKQKETDVESNRISVVAMLRMGRNIRDLMLIQVKTQEAREKNDVPWLVAKMAESKKQMELIKTKERLEEMISRVADLEVRLLALGMDPSNLPPEEQKGELGDIGVSFGGKMASQAIESQLATLETEYHKLDARTTRKAIGVPRQPVSFGADFGNGKGRGVVSIKSISPDLVILNVDEEAKQQMAQSSADRVIEVLRQEGGRMQGDLVDMVSGGVQLSLSKDIYSVGLSRLKVLASAGLASGEEYNTLYRLLVEFSKAWNDGGSSVRDAENRIRLALGRPPSEPVKLNYEEARARVRSSLTVETVSYNLSLHDPRQIVLSRIPSTQDLSLFRYNGGLPELVNGKGIVLPRMPETSILKSLDSLIKGERLRNTIIPTGRFTLYTDAITNGEVIGEFDFRWNLFGGGGASRKKIIDLEKEKVQLEITQKTRSHQLTLDQNRRNMAIEMDRIRIANARILELTEGDFSKLLNKDYVNQRVLMGDLGALMSEMAKLTAERTDAYMLLALHYQTSRDILRAYGTDIPLLEDFLDQLGVTRLKGQRSLYQEIHENVLTRDPLPPIDIPVSPEWDAARYRTPTQLYKPADGALDQNPEQKVTRITDVFGNKVNAPIQHRAFSGPDWFMVGATDMANDIGMKLSDSRLLNRADWASFIDEVLTTYRLPRTPGYVRDLRFAWRRVNAEFRDLTDSSEMPNSFSKYTEFPFKQMFPRHASLTADLDTSILMDKNIHKKLALAITYASEMQNEKNGRASFEKKFKDDAKFIRLLEAERKGKVRLTDKQKENALAWEKIINAEMEFNFYSKFDPSEKDKLNKAAQAGLERMFPELARWGTRLKGDARANGEIDLYGDLDLESLISSMVAMARSRGWNPSTLTDYISFLAKHITPQVGRYAKGAAIRDYANQSDATRLRFLMQGFHDRKAEAGKKGLSLEKAAIYKDFIDAEKAAEEAKFLFATAIFWGDEYFRGLGVTPEKGLKDPAIQSRIGRQFSEMTNKFLAIKRMPEATALIKGQQPGTSSIFWLSPEVQGVLTSLAMDWLTEKWTAEEMQRHLKNVMSLATGPYIQKLQRYQDQTGNSLHIDLQVKDPVERVAVWGTLSGMARTIERLNDTLDLSPQKLGETLDDLVAIRLALVSERNGLTDKADRLEDQAKVVGLNPLVRQAYLKGAERLRENAKSYHWDIGQDAYIYRLSRNLVPEQPFHLPQDKPRREALVELVSDFVAAKERNLLAGTKILGEFQSYLDDPAKMPKWMSRENLTIYIENIAGDPSRDIKGLMDQDVGSRTAMYFATAYKQLRGAVLTQDTENTFFLQSIYMSTHKDENGAPQRLQEGEIAPFLDNIRRGTFSRDQTGRVFLYDGWLSSRLKNELPPVMAAELAALRKKEVSKDEKDLIQREMIHLRGPEAIGLAFYLVRQQDTYASGIGLGHEEVDQFFSRWLADAGFVLAQVWETSGHRHYVMPFQILSSNLSMFREGKQELTSLQKTLLEKKFKGVFRTDPGLMDLGEKGNQIRNLRAHYFTMLGEPLTPDRELLLSTRMQEIEKTMAGSSRQDIETAQVDYLAKIRTLREVMSDTMAKDIKLKPGESLTHKIDEAWWSLSNELAAIFIDEVSTWEARKIDVRMFREESQSVESVLSESRRDVLSHRAERAQRNDVELANPSRVRAWQSRLAQRMPLMSGDVDTFKSLYRQGYSEDEIVTRLHTLPSLVMRVYKEATGRDLDMTDLQQKGRVMAESDIIFERWGMLSVVAEENAANAILTRSPVRIREGKGVRSLRTVAEGLEWDFSRLKTKYERAEKVKKGLMEFEIEYDENKTRHEARLDSQANSIAHNATAAAVDDRLLAKWLVVAEKMDATAEGLNIPFDKRMSLYYADLMLRLGLAEFYPREVRQNERIRESGGRSVEWAKNREAVERRLGWIFSAESVRRPNEHIGDIGIIRAVLPDDVFVGDHLEENLKKKVAADSTLRAKIIDRMADRMTVLGLEETDLVLLAQRADDLLEKLVKPVQKEEEQKSRFQYSAGPQSPLSRLEALLTVDELETNPQRQFKLLALIFGEYDYLSPEKTELEKKAAGKEIQRFFEKIGGIIYGANRMVELKRFEALGYLRSAPFWSRWLTGDNIVMPSPYGNFMVAAFSMALGLFFKKILIGRFIEPLKGLGLFQNKRRLHNFAPNRFYPWKWSAFEFLANFVTFSFAIWSFATWNHLPEAFTWVSGILLLSVWTYLDRGIRFPQLYLIYALLGGLIALSLSVSVWGWALQPFFGPTFDPGGLLGTLMTLIWDGLAGLAGKHPIYLGVLSVLAVIQIVHLVLKSPIFARKSETPSGVLESKGLENELKKRGDWDINFTLPSRPSRLGVPESLDSLMVKIGALKSGQIMPVLTPFMPGGNTRDEVMEKVEEVLEIKAQELRNNRDNAHISVLLLNHGSFVFNGLPKGEFFKEVERIIEEKGYYDEFAYTDEKGVRHDGSERFITIAMPPGRKPEVFVRALKLMEYGEDGGPGAMFGQKEYESLLAETKEEVRSFLEGMGYPAIDPESLLNLTDLSRVFAPFRSYINGDWGEIQRLLLKEKRTQLAARQDNLKKLLEGYGINQKSAIMFDVAGYESEWKRLYDEAKPQGLSYPELTKILLKNIEQSRKSQQVALQRVLEPFIEQKSVAKELALQLALTSDSHFTLDETNVVFQGFDLDVVIQREILERVADIRAEFMDPPLWQPVRTEVEGKGIWYGPLHLVMKRVGNVNHAKMSEVVAEMGRLAGQEFPLSDGEIITIVKTFQNSSGDAPLTLALASHLISEENKNKIEGYWKTVEDKFNVLIEAATEELTKLLALNSPAKEVKDLAHAYIGGLAAGNDLKAREYFLRELQSIAKGRRINFEKAELEFVADTILRLYVESKDTLTKSFSQTGTLPGKIPDIFADLSVIDNDSNIVSLYRNSALELLYRSSGLLNNESLKAIDIARERLKVELDIYFSSPYMDDTPLFTGIFTNGGYVPWAEAKEAFAQKEESSDPKVQGAQIVMNRIMPPVKETGVVDQRAPIFIVVDDTNKTGQAGGIYQAGVIDENVREDGFRKVREALNSALPGIEFEDNFIERIRQSPENILTAQELHSLTLKERNLLLWEIKVVLRNAGQYFLHQARTGYAARLDQATHEQTLWEYDGNLMHNALFPIQEDLFRTSAGGRIFGKYGGKTRTYLQAHSYFPGFPFGAYYSRTVLFSGIGIGRLRVFQQNNDHINQKVMSALSNWAKQVFNSEDEINSETPEDAEQIFALMKALVATSAFSFLKWVFRGRGGSYEAYRYLEPIFDKMRLSLRPPLPHRTAALVIAGNKILVFDDRPLGVAFELYRAVQKWISGNDVLNEYGRFSARSLFQGLHGRSTNNGVLRGLISGPMFLAAVFTGLLFMWILPGQVEIARVSGAVLLGWITMLGLVVVMKFIGPLVDSFIHPFPMVTRNKFVQRHMDWYSHIESPAKRWFALQMMRFVWTIPAMIHFLFWKAPLVVDEIGRSNSIYMAYPFPGMGAVGRGLINVKNMKKYGMMGANAPNMLETQSDVFSKTLSALSSSTAVAMTLFGMYMAAFLPIGGFGQMLIGLFGFTMAGTLFYARFLSPTSDWKSTLQKNVKTHEKPYEYAKLRGVDFSSPAGRDIEAKSEIAKGAKNRYLWTTTASIIGMASIGLFFLFPGFSLPRDWLVWGLLVILSWQVAPFSAHFASVHFNSAKRDLTSSPFSQNALKLRRFTWALGRLRSIDVILLEKLGTFQRDQDIANRLASLEEREALGALNNVLKNENLAKTISLDGLALPKEISELAKKDTLSNEERQILNKAILQEYYADAIDPTYRLFGLIPIAFTPQLIPLIKWVNGVLTIVAAIVIHLPVFDPIFGQWKEEIIKLPVAIASVVAGADSTTGLFAILLSQDPLFLSVHTAILMGLVIQIFWGVSSVIIHTTYLGIQSLKSKGGGPMVGLKTLGQRAVVLGSFISENVFVKAWIKPALIGLALAGVLFAGPAIAAPVAGGATAVGGTSLALSRLSTVALPAIFGLGLAAVAVKSRTAAPTLLSPLRGLSESVNKIIRWGSLFNVPTPGVAIPKGHALFVDLRVGTKIDSMGNVAVNPAVGALFLTQVRSLAQQLTAEDSRLPVRIELVFSPADYSSLGKTPPSKAFESLLSEAGVSKSLADRIEFGILVEGQVAKQLVSLAPTMHLNVVAPAGEGLAFWQEVGKQANVSLAILLAQLMSDVDVTFTGDAAKEMARQAGEKVNEDGTYTIKKALSPIEAITRDGAQIVLFNQQA
jgi:hypothetical protein